MNLFELFERFVVAQEKQAEAARLMATRGSSHGANHLDSPDGAVMTGAFLAGMRDGTEYTAKVEEKTKRTRKTKELVEVKGDKVPAEPAPVQEELPPVDPAPVIEPEVLAPTEPEITAEQLKAAAGLYCARRKVAGSANPAGDCGVLLQHFARVGKTMEVPANLRKACLDAFEANWLPAEEEDL